MLVKPSDIKVNKISETAFMGVYELDPLPTGFGNTIGNVLRRVLLSAVKGAAITQVKIAGVDHQFTTVKGVKEDVVDITLNLKQVRLKAHSDNPMVASIEKKGPGVVTAKDIKTSSDLEVINKDLVIATLSDKESVFKADLVVEAGYGYSPTEERPTSKIGTILLDALYSPVINVSYTVDATRFGSISGLDKLTITVETDGTVSPKDAIVQGVNSLRDFFRRLSEWDINEAEAVASDEAGNGSAMSNAVSKDVLVEELPLPTRTMNALKKQGISTLADLASMTDEQISDIKNLGEKSIEEIKKLLKKEGLR